MTEETDNRSDPGPSPRKRRCQLGGSLGEDLPAALLIPTPPADHSRRHRDRHALCGEILKDAEVGTVPRARLSAAPRAFSAAPGFDRHGPSVLSGRDGKDFLTGRRGPQCCLFHPSLSRTETESANPTSLHRDRSRTAFHTARQQAERAPDALHGRNRQATGLRHAARTPMRAVRRQALKRAGDHRRDPCVLDRARRA